MKRILAILAVALLIPHAHAGEIALQAGQCTYGQAKDGTFVASDRPHFTQLNAYCGSIGYADAFDPGAISRAWKHYTWGGVTGYRIAYHKFGVTRAQGLAVGDNEQFTGATCNRYTGIGCAAKFDTRASVEGMSFEATSTWTKGRWYFDGGLGLMPYNMKTHSDVIVIEGPNKGATDQYDKSSGMANRPGLVYSIGAGYTFNKDWKGHAGCMDALWIGEHRALSLVSGRIRECGAGLAYSL